MTAHNNRTYKRREGLDKIFCSFTTKRPCQWKELSHKLNEWSHKLYLSCSVSVSLQSAGGSVCFISLRLQHHDSVRRAKCLLMTLLPERGALKGMDQPRWLLWMSCLDFSAVVSVTFHPLKSSKDWNINAFRQLAAYLRRSTDLYLAASGCIVLILRWTRDKTLVMREKIKSHFPSISYLVVWIALSELSINFVRFSCHASQGD